MTTAPDALTASAAAGRPVLTKIEYRGATYDVIRKPSVLLLAELARTGSDDSPEAFGVIADFFEAVLGKDTYRRFRKAAFESDADDVETDELLPLIGQVIEGTTGRPTA